MKKSLLLFLIVAKVCCDRPLYAQKKLTVKNLIGVWQYGSSKVGDQLNQSFTFFGNGVFFFDNGKLGDDLVSTVELKGRYRLDKNQMYFTIVSRSMIDNDNIGVKESQSDFGIFEYKNTSPKVVKIKNPKELIDAVTITVITPSHIKINDEEYYKVSSNPNEANTL